MLSTVFSTLRAGHDLSDEQASCAFDALFKGSLLPEQIETLLTLIQEKGVAVDELVAAARVMRSCMIRVPVQSLVSLEPSPMIIDTCSTGGAPKTFNVSTIAAIVVAAAGNGKVLVAKHGNRSRTGRGSAEVLARLGVNLDAEPATQARCLSDAGVCFCFAINHHPAAANAAAARKALNFPTIFNLLGPLTNPAGATRQVTGVYDPVLTEKLAHALLRLGTNRAMVVHSCDGLDELTTTALTTIHHVQNNRITTETFDPQSVGLEKATLDKLRVDSLDDATELARDILQGAVSPRTDMVLLAAGAALCVASVCDSIAGGIELARSVLSDGSAWRTLEKLAAISHEPICDH